jgi:hypothetical protein
MLTKDNWTFIATYCEWPEIWALTRVCRASYNGCKSGMKIHRCRLRSRLVSIIIGRSSRYDILIYSMPLNIAHRIVSAAYVFNPKDTLGKQLQKRAEAANRLKMLGDDFYRFSIIRKD